VGDRSGSAWDDGPRELVLGSLRRLPGRNAGHDADRRAAAADSGAGREHADRRDLRARHGTSMSLGPGTSCCRR